MELLGLKKKKKMVLHRIHLQNANKPLFSVESEQCQTLGMSQGCAAWPVCHSKTVRYGITQPRQKLVSVASY